ncbi:transcriptional regulator [Coemansia asiatica]|nr:transcriptional regulator [Coemansia asiatica]
MAAAVSSSGGRSSISFDRPTPLSNASSAYGGFQAQPFASIQQQQSAAAAYLQQQHQLRQQQQQQQLEHAQQQQARPDMSDFPLLSNLPGISDLTAAQQQQQQQAAQLYRAIAGGRVDRQPGHVSHPNLTPDDFPALSRGAAANASNLVSADLAPGAGVVDQQSTQPCGNDNAAGTANGLEKTSAYKPPTANLAKAAAAAAAALGSASSQSPIGAADRYGMIGILTTNDYGFDVSKFGLPLPSAGQLYPTFGSPWTDQSQAYGLIEPDFSLPECYNATHPQQAVTKIASFLDETLFYIFYTMPRDELQLAAAEELYQRQWRYHKELRLWLTKDPESQSTARTQRGEQGVFIFFDPGVWQKVKKEFMVLYEHLEDRGPLSANAESVAAAAAAAAFRGGAQSVPPSLQHQLQAQAQAALAGGSAAADQDSSSSAAAAAAQAQLRNLIRMNNVTASQQQQQQQQQQQLLIMRLRQQQQQQQQQDDRSLSGQLAYSGTQISDMNLPMYSMSSGNIYGMASQLSQMDPSQPPGSSVAAAASKQQIHASSSVAEDVAAASFS